MENRVDKIFNYIKYLSWKYDLNISLHPMVKENLICDSRLLSLNTHSNLYCHYIKNNEDSFKKCLDYQREAFNKYIAERKDESFCNTCYAGVKEYIYPFKSNGTIVGYISVGTFKSRKHNDYIKRISYNYLLNQSNLIEFYNDLKDNSPDKKEVDILIEPLCDMIELAYSYIDEKQEMNLSCRILNYIELNYRRKLTVEELSQKFYISYSTISHRFKQETGMSVNDYINNLRIEDAKRLLKTTNLTITEIADIVGFSGVNYFINVFTKYEKISPSKYRKGI